MFLVDVYNVFNICSCFRIFVATWNVAGRSPVGSLAVDMDEWLNVKESADIYVLGYIYSYSSTQYNNFEPFTCEWVKLDYVPSLTNQKGKIK